MKRKKLLQIQTLKVSEADKGFELVENPEIKDFLKNLKKKKDPDKFFKDLFYIFKDLSHNDSYDELKQMLLNNQEMNVIRCISQHLSDQLTHGNKLELKDLNQTLKITNHANRLEQNKSTDNIEQSVKFTGHIDLNTFKK